MFYNWRITYFENIEEIRGGGCLSERRPRKINEEEFKDISDCDDASDYEEELKKMKHKMGNFTSEDEEFDEWWVLQ